MSHKYEEAIAHYENVLRNQPNNFNLRKEIIELYAKLNRPEAFSILNDSVKSLKEYLLSDNSLTENGINRLLELTEFYKQLNQIEEYVTSLVFAKQQQLKAVQRFQQHSHDDRITRSKYLMSSICVKLGDHFKSVGNDMKSVELYNESVSFDPDNRHALVGLMRYHKLKENIVECKKYCTMMDCVEAKMILANIKEMENDFEGAIKIYNEILSEDTTEFLVLSLLVPLLFRSGQIERVEHILAKYDDMQLVAGIAYAKGLYFRLTGQALKSIQHFNLCRGDKDWRANSLRHMIEIYTEIDDVHLYGDSTLNEERSKNFEVAKHLLDELSSVCDAPNDVTFYNCYISFKGCPAQCREHIPILETILDDDKVREISDIIFNITR